MSLAALGAVGSVGGTEGKDPSAPPTTRAAGLTARAWNAVSSRWPRLAFGLLSTVPVVFFASIFVVLLVWTLPAIRVNGLGFLTGHTWSMGRQYSQPVHFHGVEMLSGERYGAWPLIAGTLASSVLALAIALPVSLGAALIVVEKLSPRLSRWVGACLEVLAGIPSVVYGLWGALTLGPFLSSHLAGLAKHVPDVFVLRFFRGPTYHGEGLLTSGVVLAVMIVPVIAATARDLFRQVPSSAKDGAHALGMTDAEVLVKVIWPWSRSGIVGAAVLGLGRALGETMAVLMCSGAVLGTVPHNLYSPMSTIAATIVSQLDSALSDGTGFAIKTLGELGLVLIVITVACNLVAKVFLRRFGAAAIALASVGA